MWIVSTGLGNWRFRLNFPALLSLHSQILCKRSKDKTMPTVRRLRVSNPHKRRKNNSRRRSRRNPGEVLIVANPRKHRSSRRRSRAKSRKSNPRMSKRFSFRRRHSRRRNPSGIAGFNTNELLKLALGAGAGVVGSKYLTQMVLGSNNSGPTGYGGQAVATLALGWLAHKFVGKDAATGVVAGGLGALALRIFQEQVSGTSSSMSGLGDPDMASLGVGMGDYRASGGIVGLPGSFAPVVTLAAPARRRG
jgi:hypothetical protein